MRSIGKQASVRSETQRMRATFKEKTKVFMFFLCRETMENGGEKSTRTGQGKPVV